eukprot:gene5719-6419_t
MTEFAQEKTFLHQQLSGASDAQQHCLNLSSTNVGDHASKSNQRFILLTNTKSRRYENICSFVNYSASYGFEHRAPISVACKQSSISTQYSKSRRYFLLLKDYMNVILVTKKLKVEVESLVEQCLDTRQSVSRNLWDFSKLLNVLERYKADVKVIRFLEVKLKSFLKSEMPHLSHSRAINISGLFRFLYCSHNEIMVCICRILDEGARTLHGFDCAVLLKTETRERVNLKHLSQLVSRFDKLAFDILLWMNQWCMHWRDHTTGLVSKKGGLRIKSPFLYLKPPELPHRMGSLQDMVMSVSLSDYLEKVTVERARRVSKNILTSVLVNLISIEDNGSVSSLTQRNGSRNELGDDAVATIKRIMSMKKIKTSKRTRNIFFQDLLLSGSQEVQLLTEMIDNWFQFQWNASKISNNTNNSHKLFMRSEPIERTKELTPLSIKQLPEVVKKVHWDSSQDTNMQSKIVNDYLESFWKHVAEVFIKDLLYGSTNLELSTDKWDIPFLCMNMERMAETASFLHVKKLKADSGEIHPSFLLCVKEISSISTLVFALQRWDYSMCMAQAKSIKDKCRLSNDASPRHSETMGAMLLALDAVQDMIELITARNTLACISATQESSSHKKWLLLSCLIAFSATLQNSSQWLHSKSQQFVSSASWQQFHLVSTDDVTALQDKLRLIIPNLASLARSLHSLENIDASIIHALNDIQSNIGEIKNFNSNKIDVLVDAIRCRSEACWRHQFPAAKQWRKRGKTRLPIETNLYVKLVAHQILVPLIESVKNISRDDADEILLKCFSVYVTSLMDYILQDGIRFSLFGAHQLRLDFTCFKEWIGHDSFHISNETIAKIIALPSFVDMDSAITLLSCQPENKYRSGFTGEVDTGSSLISSSSLGSYSGSFNEDSIKDIELRTKEQWLALRVKGGQAKGKLLCISSAS